MIHNVDLHKTENVPLVVINFLTNGIYLSKGEIMGFMQNQALDTSEIVTETSTEPSPFHWKRMIIQRDLKNRRKELHSNVMKRSLSLLQQILTYIER